MSRDRQKARCGQRLRARDGGTELSDGWTGNKMRTLDSKKRMDRPNVKEREECIPSSGSPARLPTPHPPLDVAPEEFALGNVHAVPGHSQTQLIQVS